MEISEIKHRLSILQVLRHYNLTPDRNKQINCPFHKDDKPSCRIYPETNTFHCFGCGANGDVIEFIMLKNKCSKHEAITKAAGLVEKAEGRKQKAEGDQTLTVLRSCAITVSEILTRAFTHFVRSLHARPKKAVEYLASRKLYWHHLSIGFDAGTLHRMKAEGDIVTCHA
jgi:DNA primase